MENLELYLSIAATIFGLFLSTITFLVKFIKNANTKKTLINFLNTLETIYPFIEEAEKFINYTGEEKKAYVMTKITQHNINNKTKVDQSKISDTIDELVRFTKQVNVKKTKQTENVNLDAKNNLEIKYSPNNELQKLYK